MMMIEKTKKDVHFKSNVRSIHAYNTNAFTVVVEPAAFHFNARLNLGIYYFTRKKKMFPSLVLSSFAFRMTKIIM